MVETSTLVELNAGVTIQLFEGDRVRATKLINYSDDTHTVMLSESLWLRSGQKVDCVGYDESGYIIIHKENAPHGLVESCCVSDLVNEDPNEVAVEEGRVFQ